MVQLWNYSRNVEQWYLFVHILHVKLDTIREQRASGWRYRSIYDLISSKDGKDNSEGRQLKDSTQGRIH